MGYILRNKKTGEWLYRGRPVKKPYQASYYHSPSAAKKLMARHPEMDIELVKFIFEEHGYVSRVGFHYR